MAEAKLKYSALTQLRQQHQAPEPLRTEDPVGPTLADVLPAKPPKPLGKRSDPAYKQYSVLLKRNDHDAALDRLKRRGDGTDFADLMQALLAAYLATSD